ncbi:phosphate regulon sensor histidine kinase PhoR [Thiobacillus sp.]|uniref:phosphate regulon sensor histidine kinase PhoR n=1 Tax=Thiobacillus sp. TaxID=924 RepID=UPI00180D9850|nr:phosphate regulon sensor histidine kinase PhoR [Thiobacillus sp.]MBC2729568.1 phosphate regulon sensor histidine kinase PhoR [Thiobacillus sp.]MBC2738304.1 phosphate regulon sensor histidine kinase PhoR [Thiobacillus sp.]MBC2761516.1 phosphate regulon sensor histidine kinase PhoR [Thiobacillus sp.]
MGFWWRPLSVLAGVLLVALILWAGSGWVAALGFLAGVQAFVMLRRLWQEFRLARWLENPDEVEPPDATGTWGDIFYRLQKLQRRQKASRGQLTSALEQFEHAAMAVPDGMVILNRSEQIEWCNPASRTYMGLDCERDRGQFIRYLLRQAQFLDFLDAADYSRRLVCKSPVNRELILSLQLVPFGESQKLLVARDITDLERVDAMRRDFIANVSHELRTPLTVVGGFVETLADAPDLPAAESRHYFDLMLDHTRRMQHLLDDLLTLSRLESADHTLKDELVNVPELAQALKAEAESLSRGRHRVSLQCQSEACLKGSLQEIRSALGNLVSNAVRYTPEGGEITLAWRERNGEGVFSVIDTGEGIAAEHIPRLTERFYRVDRSRSRETGGTGLGLAIVKHVLTRHGARLEIQSVPGKGSTFSAVFPAQRLQLPGAQKSGTVIPFPEREQAVG